MSVFASIGAYNREEDWLVAIIGIFVVYLVIYPTYIYYLRYRHMRRIKHQIVTSIYNMPIKLTPVELAYIFSAKVKKQQIYATLLDLANRSVLVMHKNHGITTVEIGPKVDKELHPFEMLLLEKIQHNSGNLNVEKLLEGFTSHELASGTKINGSRQYVFWWLLRDTLRARNIIQKNLSKRYAMMLVVYGVISGLVVSVVSVVGLRFVQMIDYGKVDVHRLTQSLGSGLIIWLLMILPLLLVSYLILKYRGRMLGRDWIMTPKYRKYLSQMDAFREFVRLTHKGNLEFESKELYEESMAVTRPYAIACGYIKS